MAIAPIDWEYLSKTDLNVVPPLVDFHTPPLAAPTYTVSASEASPSIAEIRPLIAAGPIERASTAPNAAESILPAARATPLLQTTSVTKTHTPGVRRVLRLIV